jgi:hypothetical protein
VNPSIGHLATTVGRATIDGSGGPACRRSRGEVREVGRLDTAGDLLAFVAENDDAAELLWRAAMVTLERAAREAQDVSFPSRWQTYPSWDLRRVRRQVASALALARAAVALQDSQNARNDELYADLRAQAAASGAAQRGEQTLAAEYGRVARARARAASVELGLYEPDEVLERWAGPREAYYEQARARRAGRKHRW